MLAFRGSQEEKPAENQGCHSRQGTEFWEVLEEAKLQIL